MLLCHMMSSVCKMANNLVAMGSLAFALAVATGSDVFCTKTGWVAATHNYVPVHTMTSVFKNGEQLKHLLRLLLQLLLQ